MRACLLGAIGASLLAFASAADAQLISGVYTDNGPALLQPVQLYVYGGRNYCWYGNGWHGPGWYWCGYRLRRGYGWGGGVGWHGWARPGYVGARRGNGVRAGGRAGGHAAGHAGGHGGGHR